MQRVDGGRKRDTKKGEERRQCPHDIRKIQEAVTFVQVDDERILRKEMIDICACLCTSNAAPEDK